MSTQNIELIALRIDLYLNMNATEQSKNIIWYFYQPTLMLKYCGW